MALGIEGASIGFDANNVQTALNNLNIRCIEEAKEGMNNSMNSLFQSVDDAWVGDSAEMFKKNFAFSVNVISGQLDDTYNSLCSEIHQIVNEMKNADSELVKERTE